MNRHFRVSGTTFQKFEELGGHAFVVLRGAGLPLELIDQPRVLLDTEERVFHPLAGANNSVRGQRRNWVQFDL